MVYAASTLLAAATLLAYADIESGGAVCFIKDLGSRNKVGTHATHDDKDTFAGMASLTTRFQVYLHAMHCSLLLSQIISACGALQFAAELNYCNCQLQNARH